MRRLRTLAAAAVVLACAAVQGQTGPGAPGATSSRYLVLKNFTLIDGNGGTPLQNAALVAEEGASPG